MLNSQKRWFRIFLSSPGDVNEERQIVMKTITDFDNDPLWREKIQFKLVAWDDPNTPVAMEAPITPQEAVDSSRAMPSQCDIVVVIFWKRMGTPLMMKDEYIKEDGSQYLSGTEWEYENAVKAYKAHGRPKIMVYRCVAPFECQDDQDRLQSDRVNNFFARFSYKATGVIQGGYNIYNSAQQFRNDFKKHLVDVTQRIIHETNQEDDVLIRETCLQILHILHRSGQIGQMVGLTLSELCQHLHHIEPELVEFALTALSNSEYIGIRTLKSLPIKLYHLTQAGEQKAIFEDI